MKLKTIIAKAGVPDKQGIVFEKECLRNIAKKDPSIFDFDESTNALYSRVSAPDETLLDSIRKTIQQELPNIEAKPYSDSIISIQLEMSRTLYGEEFKNGLIDEYGLEKFGWQKNTDEIIRRSKLSG